jgi:formylglycine-generating enzyme required for sulfatase activity
MNKEGVETKNSNASVMRWLGAAVLWWLVYAQTVLAQEVFRVQTPTGAFHEVVRVPAGPFAMGSAAGRKDEQPVHEVHLDAYYIDRFEVSNAQFAAFLNDVQRNADLEGHALLDLDDADAQIHRGERGVEPIPDTATHPVVEVSWYGARAYCDWAGMALPTEAMWEKAARGTDGRTYPWGEGIDRSRANYGAEGCCRGDDGDGFFHLAPVGSYPSGASPYGALDMAGNVWEMVGDWYGEDYYAEGSGNNPQGPAAGINRVLRGGSMSSDPYRLRTTDRSGLPPVATYVIIGFRCAAGGSLATAIRSASWGRIKRERIAEEDNQ